MHHRSISFSTQTDNTNTQQGMSSTNSDHSIALYVGVAAGAVILLLVASFAIFVFRIKKAAQKLTKPEEGEPKDEDHYEELYEMSNRGKEPEAERYQEIKHPYPIVFV